ncbi:MAG: hypothetical protein OZ930_15000 [Ignavibacteria bacterium]|nr:hypothetical protein [Ignavibacteria bacterium]
MPCSFALFRIPRVPVNFTPRRFVNFLAFKSSSNNNTSSFSDANAIALASPPSTRDSINL